ncbi:hypothetical protein DFJ73DRAFT_798451 [Zopfochytrium polystomum]|nr:hypothetical protein DFJ73DRAFT_798451 [Zopfochytrium polystomum]
MAFLVGASDFAQSGSAVQLILSLALVTATLVLEHILYFHVLKIVRDGSNGGKSPTNTTMSLSQSRMIGSVVSLAARPMDLGRKSFLQRMATTMLIIAFHHPVAVLTTLRKPADQDGSFYLLVALMILFKPLKNFLFLCWSLFKTRRDTTHSLLEKAEAFLSNNLDSSTIVYQRIAIHSSNGVALIAAIFFFAADSPVQRVSEACTRRLGGLTTAKVAVRWVIVTAAEIFVDLSCVLYQACTHSGRPFRVRTAQTEDLQSIFESEEKPGAAAVEGDGRDADGSKGSSSIEDVMIWCGIGCALGLTSVVSTCAGVAYLRGLYGSLECNVVGGT